MHLLQQHILDIECTSAAVGKEVHKDVSGLMEKVFYPALEQLLNKYTEDGTAWVIDRLVIDLPNIPNKNWKQDLMTHSLAQVEEYLRSNIQKARRSAGHASEDKGHGYMVSIRQQAQSAFIAYLKTGLLPASALFKDLGAIAQLLETDGAFILQLIAVFNSDHRALVRYILNIPEEIKNKIGKNIDLCPPAISRMIHTGIETNDRTQMNAASQWAELLQWTYYFAQKNDTRQYWTNIFRELSMQYWNMAQSSIAEICTRISTLISSEEALQNPVTAMGSFREFIEAVGQSATGKNEHEISSEGPSVNAARDGKEHAQTELASDLQQKPLQTPVYIQNAGLVIFYPFLANLFERLQLCTNKEWTTTNDQHKAILLTQYLVTGSTATGENELVLNKLLCGFPLEAVVNTKIELLAQEKEEADELLRAVIGHWKALKNTSESGLRQAFLSRAGKLVMNENDAALWVEQSGVDVLLESLPWGIGTIRTPWMADHLQCHWR